MGLPNEVRREIYQHTFFPGRVRSPTPEKDFEIMWNLNVPTSLLLVSKEVKAEVLEVYFENAHTHLFINPRWVPREKMPYDDFSQKGRGLHSSSNLNSMLVSTPGKDLETC